jgi:hypothetical protein
MRRIPLLERQPTGLQTVVVTGDAVAVTTGCALTRTGWEWLGSCRLRPAAPELWSFDLTRTGGRKPKDGRYAQADRDDNLRRARHP